MAKADRDQKIGKWMLSYEASLRRYFSRRLSESEADDLVQEVFLKLQTSRSIDNVEGYIFATARNVLISRYREQAAKSHFLHDQWGEWHDVADPLSPERIAIGHEDYQRVVSAIGNLPPQNAPSLSAPSLRTSDLSSHRPADGHFPRFREGVDTKSVAAYHRSAGG